MSQRIIYGRNPVKEVLRADPSRIFLVYYQPDLDKEGRKLVAAIRSHKIPVESCDKTTLGNLCKVRQHQGIAARVIDIKNASLNQLWRVKPEGLSVLLLSAVQDPGNLGAVIRSAEHFGIDLLIIGSKESCSVQLPSVAKASAGAVEHLPILSSSNLPKVLEELKEKNFKIIGLEAGASQNLFSQIRQKKDNTCLILGSEGFGIKKNLDRFIDLTVKIPRVGLTESLNLSAASLAGVLWLKNIFNPGDNS